MQERQLSLSSLHTYLFTFCFRLLDEVRQECGVEDTSSEEEETSPVQRSKKQLFKSLCPIPSPEPTIPSVQATFSAKPTCLTNGEGGKLSSIRALYIWIDRLEQLI